MANYDKILRAYARIESIKENIPKHNWVSEDWVIEYHSALDEVAKETGKNLSEFRVPKKNLKQSPVFVNRMTNEKSHGGGLRCERNILLQKVDAILTYLHLLLKPKNKQIGFEDR
jgi:hypothetical protein